MVRMVKRSMESTYPTDDFRVKETTDVSSEETHEVLWNIGKQILELADQLGIQFEFQEEVVDGILETYDKQMKPTVAKLEHEIGQVKQVGLDNKCLQSRLLDLGNEVFKMGNQQRKIVRRQKYAEHMSVRRSPSPSNARLRRKRIAEFLRVTQSPPASPAAVPKPPSPVFSPTSPSYDPSSHHFGSSSPPPEFSPTSPTYEPSSVHYSPTSPSYDPSSHYFRSSSPPCAFSPTSPSYETR